MSVAVPFKFREAFPFCPVAAPFGTSADFDHVGGLSLAQVMDFYWNTEDLLFAFTGADTHTYGGPPVLHTATAEGSWKFNPPTVTGSFVNLTDFFYNSTSMSGEGTGAFGPIGDLAPVLAPNERVCGNDIFIGLLSGGDSNEDFGTKVSSPHTFWLQFYIGRDPADANLFAIFYEFILRSGVFLVSAGVGISYGNPSFSGAANEINQFVTGSFSIGAISGFQYRCYYNYSLSTHGITVTRSAFTYPP